MNSSKKSLRDYYEEKKGALTNFRLEIMGVLGISKETFFIRMRDDAWTDPEKRLLSQHLGVSIEVLFPESAESHA